MSSHHYSLGLLGHPVAHSLSPILHNAALAHYKLDGDYRPIDVEAGNLKEILDRLESDGMRGLNVTIPHKQAVMPFLDDLSDDVASIGAVNTIIFERNGKTLTRRGENTDVHGFSTALIEAYRGRSRSLESATAGDAILFGYGGAARAVVAGLARLGFGSIKVAGRNAVAIDSFCGGYQRSDSPRVVPLDSFASASNFSIAINATPIGQYGEPISGWVLEILSKLPKSCFVYDLVYSRSNTSTPLVEICEKQLGLKACDGLGMLLHQAAKSFELWTGHDGPVEVMRAALSLTTH